MVGNELHSSKTWKTFADFLIDYIKYALGSSWGENELKKELVDRHPIMKWYDHICRLDQARAQAGQKPDESGIRSVPADGITSAFMVLAYDLYVLRDNGKLQKRVLQRLRRPEHFDGARYEVLVAATFVRAGFDIQFEDETDPSRKHPEFIATHRATKFVVAVEAKARHRSSQAGVTEMKAGVRGLVSTAARKATGHAFALFVDVNLPPGEARRPPAWMPEVQESVVEVVAHEASGQSPFDLVLFSNIPHLHGERGQADPAKHFYFWKPSGAVPSRIPNEVEQAIAKAITQYGRIPEDFPKTE
jgi:hypothetical protein